MIDIPRYIPLSDVQPDQQDELKHWVSLGKLCIIGKWVFATLAPYKPDIERNEKCVCGSGKKWKKCCGF